MHAAHNILETVLDVQDIDASCAFWSAFGFESIETQRAGTSNEQRLLTSPDHPAWRLRLFLCRPRPVVGTTPGSLRRITLHVPDFDALLDRLPASGLRWLEGPGAEDGSPVDAVRFYNEDLYLIELRRLV
ncbi:MAG: VOC family protein [Planctomycetota bacterium]